MLVAELVGTQLDAWVAKAERKRGGDWSQHDGGVWLRDGDQTIFRPSILWECAQPIIIREIVSLTRHGPMKWSAFAHGAASGHGNTALIAAMRAYVASNFGNEVFGEADQ